MLSSRLTLSVLALTLVNSAIPTPANAVIRTLKIASGCVTWAEEVSGLKDLGYNTNEIAEKRRDIYTSQGVSSVELYPFTEDKTFPSKQMLLDDPDTAFLAKIGMTETAKYTWDRRTYISTDSDENLVQIKADQMAVQRGVNVRVMIDSLGSLKSALKFHAELKALVATEGGQIIDKDGNPVWETTFDKNGKEIKVLDKNGKPVPVLAKAEVVIYQSAFAFIPTAKALISKLFAEVPITEGDITAFHYWRDHRSHSKDATRDRDYVELAMTKEGGRNEDNQYYGTTFAPEDVVYNDNEILVAHDVTKLDPNGPTISKTAGSDFDRHYYHPANTNLWDGKIVRRTPLNAQKRIDAAWEKYMGQGTPFRQRLEKMKADGFFDPEKGANWSSGNARFVSQGHNASRHNAGKNPSPETNPKNRFNPNGIDVWTDKMMFGATGPTYLVSPYAELLEQDEHTSAVKLNWRRIINIREKVDAGVPFTIVLNSVASTDNMQAQAIVDRLLVAALAPDSGIPQDFLPAELRGWVPKHPELINIYELRKGVGKLHEKSLLVSSMVDDKGNTINSVTGILSYNFDLRSGNVNSETGWIVSEDPVLMQKQIARVQKLIATKAIKVGSPEWFALRNSKDKKIAGRVRQQPAIVKGQRYFHVEFMM